MIKVYALSGSHGIGKTTTFRYLKELLPNEKFAFVGEFADSILRQMGIRHNWKETIFKNCSAYHFFESALDFCTIASYLTHKDKVIVADRSIVDICGYRLLAELPLSNISLLNLYGIRLYTFFMRSERENREITEAIKNVLVEFKLPFDEVKIIEGKPKETAMVIADRIMEMENERREFSY